MRFWVIAMLLCCCQHGAVVSRDAGSDAGSINVAPYVAPRDDGGHHLKSSQPGHIHRTDNFIDGTGITTNVVDNTTTGQADITISSNVVGGVSSVTGAGTVSCSPTTGAVTCTGTNAVSSVSGTSGVSCSPTTGAVTCSNTGVTGVSAGSGISVSGSTGSVTITNTSPGGGGVSSVTGAGIVSCNPTTGAVICGSASGSINTMLVTNNSGVVQYLPPGGDIGLSGGITGSSVPLFINFLQGFPITLNSVALGQELTFISGSPNHWANVSHAFALSSTGACTITSTLATCASVSVNAVAGQRVSVWNNVQVHSTDTSDTFLILMSPTISPSTTVTVSPAPGSGPVAETDVQMASQSEDTILVSGTHTYNIQLAHTEGATVSVGVLQAPVVQVRAQVWGNP